MTLILNLKDVEQAINMRTIIEHIEQGLVEEYHGNVQMPPRMNMPTNNQGFFRLMPAVMNDSGYMGFKAFFKSGPRVRYLIGIIDQHENNLEAMMDSSYLTAVRTGATTGLATKYMARENAKTVGVIGSGLEARTNLEAVCAVRDIEYVKVYSPTPQRRELFATEMSEKLGIRIEAVDSPNEAVDGVDIVNVCTNTSTKGNGVAFEGKWMRKSMHVNSIGSTMPTMREIDTDSFEKANVIVIDTKHLENESGDVLNAIKSGQYDHSKVVELKELVVGQKVRTNEEQITLFKSVGTAVQDIMAARAVYNEAKKLNLGTDVGDFLEAKMFN
ncbi:ornithine cyclodeaminase family protein [Neobacillus drentensis]|uniref:ornithine cyclodeaminase family protein n=1 Tax=Neobacillus drentensis TaxID=220684 RepID=UPI00285B2A16|nr:ornithine cyclodeaminase family protein [Neobacillus drentensis]MDR7236408.1 ornithine cyclodeaminase/alanine dehydrogenase-like protein (mu-crystallin family) [Neobacillus drentensis]